MNCGPIEAELEALRWNYIDVVHDSILASFGHSGKSGKKVIAKNADLSGFRFAFLAKSCQNQGMEISAEVFSMMRIAAGLDPDEMAEQLGVSRRTISNWESNGVPRHRNALVMSKFGPSVTSAREQVERAAWERTPEGMASMDAWYEEAHSRQEAQDNEHLVWDFLSIDESPSVNEYLRLKKVVSSYSTASLARVLASRLTDSERLDSRLAAHRRSGPDTGLDPDYSNMSAEDAKDYGLAAKPEDEHIAHDELPNQP